MNISRKRIKRILRKQRGGRKIRFQFDKILKESGNNFARLERRRGATRKPSKFAF